MKVAYCIAGHTREFDRVMTSTNIDFREKENFDFYISTWIKKGVNTTFWMDEPEGEENVDVESVINLYKPKKWDFENIENYDKLKVFNRNFKKSSVSVLNTLLMFKKIKNSISYTDESYDIVVRSRFDIQELNVKFEKCQDNIIYGKLSPINGLPSDIFFYGNYETMKNAIPDEVFYTDQILSNCINAEDVFNNYLKSKNIKFIVDKTLNYKLKNVNY